MTAKPPAAGFVLRESGRGRARTRQLFHADAPDSDPLGTLATETAKRGRLGRRRHDVRIESSGRTWAIRSKSSGVLAPPGIDVIDGDGRELARMDAFLGYRGSSTLILTDGREWVFECGHVAETTPRGPMQWILEDQRAREVVAVFRQERQSLLRPVGNVRTEVTAGDPLLSAELIALVGGHLADWSIETIESGG